MLTSQSAGITAVSHHAWPLKMCFKLPNIWLVACLFDFLSKLHCYLRMQSAIGLELEIRARALSVIFVA